MRVLTTGPNAFWLGYLPEGRNETVARLLDAGYPLSARLTHKAWEDEWLHLEIEVLAGQSRNAPSCHAEQREEPA